MIEHVKKTEGPGIIYTQSRAKTENISLMLLEQGIAAAAYHAGKDAQDRQFIQQQFIAGDLDWIIATNAFGMGVHKNNIRQVIHESMPATVANYMQEIGRAGRDGKDSLVFLLYADGDEQFAKFIVTDDLPKAAHAHSYADMRARRENPVNMINAGEISETAFRVLHYWMQQETLEEVKSRLLSMEIKKYEAVKAMMKIIETEGCMRALLVEHFGQILAYTPDNCCSGCGMDYDRLLRTRQQVQAPVTTISWQTRLRQLLIQDV